MLASAAGIPFPFMGRFHSHRRLDRGFTLIELLTVMAIVVIVVAIGLAGYRNARLRANETAAVAALNAISQAQAAFAQVCGNSHFAPSLVALGTPIPATAEPFLSADLTLSDPIAKSGYVFVLSGTVAPEAQPSCIGVMPVAGYQVTADPLTPGATGVRFFGTNAERILYEDVTTFAGSMPETGAPAHGAEIK
jgi:prepilin-type N-terminal cleavage/methylation domain-containing protein